MEKYLHDIFINNCTMRDKMSEQGFFKAVEEMKLDLMKIIKPEDPIRVVPTNVLEDWEIQAQEGQLDNLSQEILSVKL